MLAHLFLNLITTKHFEVVYLVNADKINDDSWHLFWEQTRTVSSFINMYLFNFIFIYMFLKLKEIIAKINGQQNCCEVWNHTVLRNNQ